MESKVISPASMPIACAGEKTSFFAVDLTCEAEAEARGKTVRAGKEVKHAVERVLSSIKYSGGMWVSVESKIPRNYGLGALWAHQTAASFAAAAAAAKTDGGVYELKVDKYLRERFLIHARVLFGRNEILGFLAEAGGNYGRLAASTFGGFVVCDGKNILRRGETESLRLKLSLPRKPLKKKETLFGFERELAWGEALSGNLYTAMRLNSLIDGDRVRVERVLKDGALSVSATGKGAVAGLYRGRAPKNTIPVSNEGTVFSGKPKKILKTAEFLKLKGAQDFTLL